MWVFTIDGFFSVVHKPQQKAGMVTVRSRSRRDLLWFLERVDGAIKDIKEHAGTDYEFRVEISEEKWRAYLGEMSQKLNYSNFKDEVSLIDKKRGSLYLQVWLAMLHVFEPRKKRKKSKDLFIYEKVL
jgi:hypothetical protein